MKQWKIKNYSKITFLNILPFFYYIFTIGTCPPCVFPVPPATFCNVEISNGLCVNQNAQINGDLTVCGTINAQISSSYAFSYLSVQLPFSQPNFWTDVAFDTNGPFNNWAHDLGSPSFICGMSGIYFITYSAITQSEGTSVAVTVELAVAVNGNLLPESSAVTTHINIDQPQSATRSILTQLNVGDEVKVQLRYAPNGRADLIPPIGGSSIAFTAFRIG